MKKIRIKKQSGKLEEYNSRKHQKYVEYAIEGLSGVSASEIEMGAAASILDGVTSKNIQLALIKSAADRITENEPDYQIAASRLLNQDIRKEVYGTYTPRPFLDQIKEGGKKKYYDTKYLLKHYTEKELIEYGKLLRFDRDDLFVYSGLKKTADSYLTKQYGKIKETPQEMYMLIVLFAFAKYEGDIRKKWVKEGYQILSTFEASLPTPIMIQLRTLFRKFISCNLVAPSDDNETLANASKVIQRLVAAGAGLGIGNTVRGEGADIDNGRIQHTGCLPLYKGYEKLTKSFVQPSRDGSSTVYHPFFHVEIESFMVWGNAKGTEETRIRDMDHNIMFNELFFERYAKDEDITLFYLNDVKDIVSVMGDHKKFKKQYEEAERTVPKKNQRKIKASLIFDTFIDERFLQSREYTAFLDNIQKYSMWIIPIVMSNLCTEINVPVFPIRDESLKRNINFNSDEDRQRFYELRNDAYFHPDDEKLLFKYQLQMSKLYTFSDSNMIAEVDESKDFDYFTLTGLVNLSEVGVCILGGINMGNCTDERLPIVSEFLVRFLEEIIDYSTYSLPEVEKAAKMRRTIGIGFSDVFHLLVKNKKFYNTREGRQFVANRVELCSYHMIKTSVELAKERGACQLVSDTKYNDGIVPIDTYCRNVDELVGPNEEFDLEWWNLKEELKANGIRHSTLMANAPYGSSSMVSNSTPGIEPPRFLETSKKGVTKLVPDLKKYGKYYTTAWGDDFNNIDYFKFATACFQKFMDQTISLNQYHNLLKTNGKKSKRLLIEETLTLRYYGGRTMYYSNILSNEQTDGEADEESSCGSGGCEV